MEKYVDLELSLEANKYLLLANRENLCWLMNKVSCDREDSWRDQKFKEIQDKINYYVMEREVLLESLNTSHD